MTRQLCFKLLYTATLSILSWTTVAQCSYTLNLLDSYGDGWNGNSIDVYVGGSTSTYTLSSGSSIAISISASSGDSLAFEWQAGGSYLDECTFNIVDNASGGALYTSPTGNLLSTTSPQYTTSCANNGSVPCLFSSPFNESFSGAAGGWIPPSSQFNIGSLNLCWDQGVYTTYNWIKAPSPNSSLANQTGPSGDHTNGGSGYLSCDPYFFATPVSESSLITPYISLDGDSLPQVSFWYHLFGSDIEKLEIAIATDTAGPWSTIDSLFPNTGAFVSSASPWHQAIYDISNYNDDTVAFRFTAYRDLFGLNLGGNSRVSIDDFAVNEDTISCDKPIKVRVTSLGVTSAQLAWDTTGAGLYQVQWGNGTTAPTQGTTSSLSSNQFSLSNLTSNSSYTFRVRSICGVGDTSTWSEYVTIETGCGALLAPWEETFEGSDWVAPLSWFDQGTFGDCFLDSGSLGFYWKVARTPKNGNEGPSADHTPTGGGKFLATNYRYGSTAPANLSFTSPWIALDSITNPELRFWLHAFTNTNGFVTFGKLTATVEYLNGQTVTVFDTTGALQPFQNSPWKEVIVPLNQSLNDTVRVTIGYKPSVLTAGQPFSVDDISIDEAPSCPQPRYLKTLSTTTTSATLKWSTGGATNHQVRFKKVNTSTWTIVNVANTQTILNSLDPNTKYRWEVRDSCAANDKSVWTKGPAFYTSCTVYTAPYSNNFSDNQWVSPSAFSPSGAIGNCFTRFEDRSDDYFWSGARSGYDHAVFTGPQNDHTGGFSGYIFTRALGSTADTAKIELPLVYLGQLLSPEFSFWYHMYGNGIAGLKVYARKLGGSDTLIATFTGAQQTSPTSSWTKQACSLSAFQGDTVIVSFQAFSGAPSFFGYTSAAVCIDDISFEGTSTCPAPTLLAASNVTANSATLSWQGTSNVSIIEYDPSGFTLGTGQVINPASSPYTLTGLSPNTTYTVFVKDSCGTNLLSSNVTINLTTLSCPAVTAQGSVTVTGTIVSGVNTSTSNDSIFWQWGDGNSSVGDSVSYSYPLPGVYDVQQIAYNYCGNSDTTTTTITVCGTVVSSFNVSNNGLTNTFNAGASVGAALSYSWNFGDGSTANGVNPTHTYALAGTYTISLVVTDACGTSDSKSQNISICANISPTFTNTATGTTSFNFTAQPSGLSNYSWDFGDGTVGNGSNVSHSYANIGTFTVTLTCLDSCNSTYTFTDTVSTCAALSANFTFNIGSSSTTGLLVTFFASVSGTTGLIWDWGDGTQTTTQASNISHQYPTVSLNYIITLRAYNECGDTLTVTKTLNEIGLNESDLEGCRIYPNPITSDILHIEFTSPQEGRYLLYNATGQLIQSQEFIDRKTVYINTSDIAPGTYLLNVENQQAVLRKLVIKL